MSAATEHAHGRQPCAFLSEVFCSFQGEGACVGEEHLFLRFAGCPLRCRYCDTPHSLTRTPSCAAQIPGQPACSISNPLALDVLEPMVREAVRRRPSLQKIAITGGEPLLQWRFLVAFLPRVRELRPILLETAGIHVAALREVLAHVDVVSMDFKLPSNSGESGFWQEHEEFLACALERSVYVKILVDEKTAAEEVERAVRTVNRIHPHAPVFLQPIHDEQGKPAVSTDRLQHFFLVARGLHEPVRVLPQVHKLLGIP